MVLLITRNVESLSNKAIVMPRSSNAPNWVETELNETSATALGRSNSPKRSFSMRQLSGYDLSTKWKSPVENCFEKPASKGFDYTSTSSWKYMNTLDRPSSANEMISQRQSNTARSADNGISAQDYVGEAKRQSYMKMHEHELESQRKLFETKLTDEKRSLEQQYDREIKRLMEKKREEVEETHTQYRKKITDLECKSKELGDKLAALSQEADAMRRGKDRQLAEVKNLAQTNLETLQREYEAKIQSLHAQFENDRTGLEQAHAENVQELVEDTNRRLQKMESEYVQQQTATTKLIEELESRILSLTGDLDRHREEKFDLERRNMELEYECRTLNDGFLELKSRLEKFEHKYVDTVDSMRKDKQDTVSKYESNCEVMKKSHAEKVDEMMQKICEMDDRMLQMKQQLQDTKLEADRRVKEVQNNSHTELINCQQGYEKRLKEMQLNYDLDMKELQAKIIRAEENVKDKDVEVDKLIELHKREMKQTQAAFDKFKKQVDTSHTKVYEEMKKQIDRIEQDLNESKALREQQASEYDKTINTMRFGHEKTLEELRAKHEEERTRILKEWAEERQQLSDRHDQSLENLRMKLEQRIANTEIGHKSELKKRDKLLNEVESHRDKLREEIIELEATRKQQLMEVGLKMEQLRTKFNSDRELIAAKCRAAADTEKQEIMEKHEKELKDVLMKSSDREKQLEYEWRSKLKVVETSSEQLQQEIESWRNEAFREQQEHEAKLEDLLKRKNQELNSLRNEHSSKYNNLLNDLDVTQLKVKSLEKRLTEREAHYEHEMNQLILTHNSKLKNMLPTSVRHELEATIDSLKSQVHSLQQTVLILQSGAGNLRFSSGSPRNGGGYQPSSYTKAAPSSKETAEENNGVEKPSSDVQKLIM